ncbi:MAG: hypothetical protein Q8Q12_09840 [bacterium]|nr:hypothetical protein [bacterium]
MNQAPTADAGDNIEILSEDQACTTILGMATDSDGDVIEYQWLEEGVLLLDWTPVGPDGEASLDLGTLPCFSVGDHTLALKVSDGDLVASEEMILTVDNSPPVAVPAPLSQLVKIGIDPITVVADVSDFDGNLVAFEWRKEPEILHSGIVSPPQGGGTVPVPDLFVPAGDVRFPVGVHSIELRVSDGVNDAVSVFVSAEVIDSIAPTLAPVPSATILWPPNHQLQLVTIWANALDNGGGTIHLDVSVESSEPPDADGDGNTIPDHEVVSVDDVTGVIELLLRSERSGKGDGRTYIIVITATDASGNCTQGVLEILAPHDKRKS